MASGGTFVGVVVVHYQTPEVLTRCLASILDDPSQASRRVVVVDNSDTPGGALSPGNLPEAVLLHPCPDNPGFGEGANRGVHRLKAIGESTAYVILNADVELLPGYLDAALDALGKGAGAAAGPVYLNARSGPLWYAGGATRLLTGTVRQSKNPSRAKIQREVTFIPGAAIAVAPHAWDQVGGFTSDIFLYHEDLDLCRRLRKAGWKLWFAPAMRAVHHLGQATGSSERSPLYLEQMAKTRFRPYHSRLYRTYLAGLHTGYILARALRYALRGRPGDRDRSRALIRGHLAALKDLWSDGTALP